MDATPEGEDLDRTIARPGAPVPRSSSEDSAGGTPEVERTLASGASVSRADLPPGVHVPTVPNVTIQGTLGTGGQGVVYLGHQEYLDRAVAVKVLHKQIDPSFSKRFQREAKILAGLQHPNIVACHQAGVTEDDHCYMVMEFIDGPDLFERVAEQGPMAPDAALLLVRDLAEALAHGLEAAIVHRDVKPQNVLLQEVTVQGNVRLRAKLADLGLARCAEDSAEFPQLTTAGAIMGTPTTMAPEQFDAPESVDHRADIYGLGCVLFYALTGRPAFEGKTITELYRKKTARELTRNFSKEMLVPPAVQPLIARMLAADPARRIADYGDVTASIDAVLAGKAAPLRGQRAGDGGSKSLAAFGGVVAVALGLGLAWFALGSDEETTDEPRSADVAAVGESNELPNGGDAATEPDEPAAELSPGDGTPMETGNRNEDPDASETSGTEEPSVEPPPPEEPRTALLPPLISGKKLYLLEATDQASFLGEWTLSEGATAMGTAEHPDSQWSEPRLLVAPGEAPAYAERVLRDGEWTLEGHLGGSVAGRGQKTFTSRVALVGDDVPSIVIELSASLDGGGVVTLRAGDTELERIQVATRDAMAVDLADVRFRVDRTPNGYAVTLGGGAPAVIDAANLGGDPLRLDRIRLEAANGFGRWWDLALTQR